MRNALLEETSRAGFYYTPQAYYLTPAQPGVNTGSIAGNLAVNTLLGVYNVATMPVNAVSEVAALPGNIIRWTTGNEGDARAVDFAMAMASVEQSVAHATNRVLPKIAAVGNRGVGYVENGVARVWNAAGSITRSAAEATRTSPRILSGVFDDVRNLAAFAQREQFAGAGVGQLSSIEVSQLSRADDGLSLMSKVDDAGGTGALGPQSLAPPDGPGGASLNRAAQALDDASRTAASAEDTVSIWRAPRRGKGELENGYSPANHPRDRDNDGNVYFAGPRSRQVAEEYARHGPYEDGVLEVRIPRADYDAHFAKYERRYQGGPDTELPIPREVFDVLNKFQRIFHPTR